MKASDTIHIFSTVFPLFFFFSQTRSSMAIDCELSIKPFDTGCVQLMIFIEAFITMFVHMLDTIRFDTMSSKWSRQCSDWCKPPDAAATAVAAAVVPSIFTLTECTSALSDSPSHTRFTVHFYSIVYSITYAQFNHYDIVSFALACWTAESMNVHSEMHRLKAHTHVL